MLKVIKQCAAWLDWKLVTGGLAMVVVLALCNKLPALGLLAGVTPLLLVAACLAPCLIPLALIRGASRRERIKRSAGEEG